MSCNRFGIGLNPKMMLHPKARLPGGTYTGKHLTEVCQCLAANCQRSLPQQWAVQLLASFCWGCKQHRNTSFSQWELLPLTSKVRQTGTWAEATQSPLPWQPIVLADPILHEHQKYINHQTVLFDLFRVPLSRYRLFIFIPWNLSR